jgi:hypothetical protein
LTVAKLKDRLAELAMAEQAVRNKGQLKSLRDKLSLAEAENVALAKELAQLQNVSEHWRLLNSREPRAPRWEKFVRRPGGHSTAVLNLSDWHSEERVNADQINWKNDFNLEVCRLRVWEVVESCLSWLEYARQMATIDELVVALLGDMIAGWIHEELVQSNFLSPIAASLWVGELLIDVLTYLLKHSGCKHIIVPTCHGNHGRLSPKKTVSTSAINSIEWGMYHWLALHFKNEPRIAFKIEKGIQNYLPIQGRLVRFTHGDYVKFNGGVGGVTIPVEKRIKSWNNATRVDLDVFGHFHQCIRHWSWVCNGCVVGWNDYAVAIAADYQEPSQTFLCIDRRRGMWLCEPLFAIGDKELAKFKRKHGRPLDLAAASLPPGWGVGVAA